MHSSVGRVEVGRVALLSDSLSRIDSGEEEALEVCVCVGKEAIACFSHGEHSPRSVLIWPFLDKAGLL